MKFGGEENRLEPRWLSSFIFAGQRLRAESLATGLKRFALPPECIKICHTERERARFFRAAGVERENRRGV